MPFRKISDLPAGTAQGGELIPATQSGTTRKLTLGRGVGNIPFIATDGLQGVANKSFFALGAHFSLYSGYGSWVRIATITLASNYTAAKITFIVDRAGSDTFVPSQIMVYVWRTNSAVPPVPAVYLGLEPLARSAGVPIISDAALVETSAGVVELWAAVSPGSPIELLVYAFGTANTPPVLGAGVADRYTAPPAPVTGGANIRWSTDTSNRLWTGRIVEAGSGLNGSYIRFSDGTQIAQHTIPSSSFGSQLGSGTFTDPYLRLVSWTFPAAFAATPVVQVSVESTASGIVVARTTACSSTSANIRVEYAANNAAFTANLLAIGRWY